MHENLFRYVVKTGCGRIIYLGDSFKFQEIRDENGNSKDLAQVMTE
jgi:hypothetical protein